ncbi:hypothetical protein GGF37_002293, partial [Kickxella alabastrina]
MVSIDALLAAAPDSVKNALDQDTLDYLGSMIADESDPAVLREAAEPFFMDAGMSESELDAMFAGLSIAPTSKEEEPQPAAKLLQPLATKSA